MMKEIGTDKGFLKKKSYRERQKSKILPQAYRGRREGRFWDGVH